MKISLGYTFSKNERLCSKKLIEDLMQKGNPSCLQYPLLFAWKEMPAESLPNAQVLIVASKKKFNLAVDRNRLKRLIREAYRLNKPVFFDGLKGKIIILKINYIGSDILHLNAIQEALKKGLKKINHELSL